MAEEKYFIVITTTNKEDEAKRIANILLNKRLAACVNILPGVISKYWWNKDVVEEKEYLLLIKTREGVLEDVKKEILVNHTYDIAEYIALPIQDISMHFANWIDKETNKKF